MSVAGDGDREELPGSPTLRTDRLVLRPWRPEEAERLLDIRSRPDVAQWLPGGQPWTDVAVALDHIEGWGRLCAEPGPLGVWAIVPDGVREPVGTVKLDHLPGDVEVEVGWTLHPDATGRGYATEAAREVIAHAERHGIERVFAVMWAHNDASARVARAAGMVDLGVVLDPWYGEPEEPTSRVLHTGPAPELPLRRRPR